MLCIPQKSLATLFVWWASCFAQHRGPLLPFSFSGLHALYTTEVPCYSFRLAGFLLSTQQRSPATRSRHTGGCRLATTSTASLENWGSAHSHPPSHIMTHTIIWRKMSVRKRATQFSKTAGHSEHCPFPRVHRRCVEKGHTTQQSRR